jgi:hypothetical protein
MGNPGSTFGREYVENQNFALKILFKFLFIVIQPGSFLFEETHCGCQNEIGQFYIKKQVAMLSKI